MRFIYDFEKIFKETLWIDGLVSANQRMLGSWKQINRYLRVSSCLINRSNSDFGDRSMNPPVIGNPVER